MKITCIYHSHCADGFGAALAVHLFVKRKFPEAEVEWVPAQYGNKAPDVTGRMVYIVDFSYPREVLLEMKEQAGGLVVIDHHKTSEAALEGLNFCLFDMTKSGAVLAWEFFNPYDTEVPVLLQYIQDRDLWKWELNLSKEISAGLSLIPMQFDEWAKYLYDVLPLHDSGKTVLRRNDQLVLAAVNNPREYIELGGHRVPCINATTLISEIGNEISRSHPFAVMYFDTDDKRVYSLRSQKGAVDVSEIAKQFGGGGHANAAGFSTPKPTHILTRIED